MPTSNACGEESSYERLKGVRIIRGCLTKPLELSECRPGSEFEDMIFHGDVESIAGFARPKLGLVWYWKLEEHSQHSVLGPDLPSTKGRQLSIIRA
jgi:hypothetical protein